MFQQNRESKFNNYETSSLAIGERLKNLRIKRDLSQIELSVQLGGGISNRTLSNWENGNREISHTDLIRLSHFFGVTTDYLLGVSKHPTIEYSQTARELDFSQIISTEAFPHDQHALSTMDYLFQIITNEIIQWEQAEEAGNTQNSGIVSLIEYFVALTDCIRECSTPVNRSEHKVLLLEKLLNGFRDYVGEVISKGFSDDDLVKIVKGQCDLSDIEHDIREVLTSI